MVYVLLGTGFEEIEALTPVDLLRRGGIEVRTVGINGKVVYGSHKIGVEADILLEEMDKAGIAEQCEEEAVVTEVDMKKTYGGTYEVACSVNGLPLKMVFDTGASDVTISSVEASFMLKNGYLSDSDVKGTRNYMTASGDIHEGTILRLKEVKLGDAVLRNIEASVVHSQKAPLLLGQSVLEKFGTITIDNVNSKLLIKQ